MVARPELVTMSPALLYIAGLMTLDEVRALPQLERTYYCAGADTDGGCGEHHGQSPCTTKVHDADRQHVTSDFVTRFTFDGLVKANGGPRDPATKFRIIRHGAVHVSNRLPSEAEIAFYTLLWRSHETETEPYDRYVCVRFTFYYHSLLSTH